MMDYLFHVAFTHYDDPLGFGRDAFKKWCRAKFAEDETCCAVLGTVTPKNLRILKRRVTWGSPLIKGG